MQVDIVKIEKRLSRLENMLAQALRKMPPEKPKRMSEKKLIENYGVSIYVLRRMRLGYRRKDGVEVPPTLFHWGHIKGRRIDYDVAEFEAAFKRTIL